MAGPDEEAFLRAEMSEIKHDKYTNISTGADTGADTVIPELFVALPRHVANSER